jgi:outer membrane protein OmpU
MKKVLFATTALVAFAGAAAAEVKLSGYAEMGILGGDAVETQFHHDFDVKFTLSGETDGGMSFGATIDLDEVSNGISNRQGPHSVFIKGAFGTLTMGDTDGALDWAMDEVAMLTAIADDHSTHAGYNGNGLLDGAYDGQVVRYEYSFGDFSVGASAELDDTGVNDPMLGVGVKYKMSMGDTTLKFGLAYQGADDLDTDAVAASIKAELASGFTGVVNYWTGDTGGIDTTHMAVGVGYTTGALSLHANYGQFDIGGTEIDGFGLAANYDLGGGAVLMAGYGSGDVGAGNSNGTDTFSLGLGLSF